MKNLKIVIGIIITAVVVAFVGYRVWQRVRGPWNRGISRDYVYNEQLPYYRKDKQTVMKMLPKPASDYIDTVYVDSLYGWGWPHAMYRNQLEESANSRMAINIVDWFLDERKSRLQIIFVQEDSLWIADYAGQWNPEGIYF